MTSQLLIRDKTIILLPKLVIALDSMERAAILQQLHWLTDSRHSTEFDGQQWIVGDMEELTKKWFPFWKPGTLRKHINKLENDGWIISIKPSKKTWNQQKYFRVNLAKIAEYEDANTMQDDDATSIKHDHARSIKHDHARSIKHDHAISTSGMIMPDDHYKRKKREGGGSSFSAGEETQVIPLKLRTQLTDALLSVTGKLEIANAGDDRVLKWAQDDVAILWKMGVRHPDNIHEIAEQWKKEDWRAKDGGLPTNQHVKEYAVKWKESSTRAEKLKRVIRNPDGSVVEIMV